MTEILRTVGILLKRSEAQQKKIRRILHCLTNFVARTWLQLPSLRTRKIKVTHVLFYALLMLVLFYILSGRSRSGGLSDDKNDGKLFSSENSRKKLENFEREGLESQLNSNRIMFDKKFPSAKRNDGKPHEGENIGYEILNSARTFHIEGLGKTIENGVALEPGTYGKDGDLSRTKSDGVPRSNPRVDEKFRLQNKKKLFTNEGQSSRNENSLLKGVRSQNDILGRPVVNPHNYRLLLDNDGICGTGSQVSLFISVLSSTRHFEQRAAVRRTWGGALSLAPLQARLAFFLASPPPQETHLQSQIRMEAQTYGDIIQEDFLDTYHNLTLKSVMALKWVKANCPQAEYFMKTDDDIFVNIPKLLTFLREQSQLRDNFVVGCIKQQKSFTPVNLPSSYSMPPAHPLFLAGAGYVVTGALVPLLHKASLHTPIIPVEDVYVTGHLARRVGAHPPLHHPHFTCGELLLDDCDAMQVFTGHRITPRRMLEIWDKINPVEYSASPCFDF